MSIPKVRGMVRTTLTALLSVFALMLSSGFAFSATAPRVAPKAQNLGPEDASKQISVTVWLKQHNKAALDELVRQMYQKGSPNYHQWLTREQYNANFAPTAQDTAAVSNFLTSHNLSVSSVDKNHHFVSAQGRIADVQNAFNVQINRFKVNGAIHRMNTAEPSVQGPVGSLVASVHGLSDLQYQSFALRSRNPETGKPFAAIPLRKAVTSNGLFFSQQCLRTRQTVRFTTPGGGPSALYSGSRYGADITSGPPNLPTCGYDSSEIQTAYGLNALYNKGWDGTGQTIVIVDAFGSDTILDDANTFSTLNSLPALDSSNFQIITPTGPTSCGTDCINGNWNLETTLDVEWAHAVAPGANIALVLAADASFTNIDLSFLFAVETGLGNVISNSYGVEELLLQQFLPTEVTVENTLNQLAASFGMSAQFSSGDFGDYFPVDGFTTVSMPASSPFATGIGGTSLFLGPTNNIKFQTGWGNNITRIAEVSPNPPTVPPLSLGFIFGSGGGTSAVWSKPDFQSGLPGNFRLVPDISYLADPETGVEIIFTDPVSGDQLVGVIGGTSLACPMFSALWAITNQAAGAPLGLAATYVYSLPPAAIKDILQINGPSNAVGVIKNPPNPPVTETAAALAAPLGNTTNFVSTLFNSPTSTRWDVLTFGTDTSLTTGPGWDNVTGVGTPRGLTFVNSVLRLAH